MKIEDILSSIKIQYAATYVDLFEKVLRTQIDTIKAKRLARYQREFWMREAIRTFRYSFFLRYYALFESHLTYICDRVAQEKALSIRLKDIRRTSFLDRFDKYITQVAGFNSPIFHRSWSEVLVYAQIRNLIIHNDGYLKDIGSRKMLRYYLRKTASVYLDKTKRICLRKQFCYRVLFHMSRFLLQSYSF